MPKMLPGQTKVQLGGQEDFKATVGISWAFTGTSQGQNTIYQAEGGRTVGGGPSKESRPNCERYEEYDSGAYIGETNSVKGTGEIHGSGQSCAKIYPGGTGM
jgi:hypothetical protein